MAIKPASYKAPFYYRNAHIQTIGSSVGLRKAILQRRQKRLASPDTHHIIACADNIRLLAVSNIQPHAKGLVIILHGWEGAHDSAYMLSLCQHLYANNLSVVRLNLRDHGPSHYLNKGIFNSTLLPEVIDAVEHIQHLFPYEFNTMIGFSLGGNFTLRLAADAFGRKINFKQCIAFSPALDPAITMQALNQPMNKIYEQYFVYKWRKSLFKKAANFSEEYGFSEDLRKMRSLDEMNAYFIPQYTEYKQLSDYFADYALTGKRLQNLIAPCHIITSKDDPIIPWQTLHQLALSPQLSIELSQHGGHCAFMSGLTTHSWQNDKSLYLIKQALTQSGH